MSGGSNFYDQEIKGSWADEEDEEPAENIHVTSINNEKAECPEEIAIGGRNTYLVKISKNQLIRMHKKNCDRNRKKMEQQQLSQAQSKGRGNEKQTVRPDRDLHQATTKHKTGFGSNNKSGVRNNVGEFSAQKEQSIPNFDTQAAKKNEAKHVRKRRPDKELYIPRQRLKASESDAIDAPPAIPESPLHRGTNLKSKTEIQKFENKPSDVAANEFALMHLEEELEWDHQADTSQMEEPSLILSKTLSMSTQNLKDKSKGNSEAPIAKTKDTSSKKRAVSSRKMTGNVRKSSESSQKNEETQGDENSKFTTSMKKEQKSRRKKPSKRRQRYSESSSEQSSLPDVVHPDVVHTQIITKSKHTPKSNIKYLPDNVNFDHSSNHSRPNLSSAEQSLNEQTFPRMKSPGSVFAANMHGDGHRRGGMLRIVRPPAPGKVVRARPGHRQLYDPNNPQTKMPNQSLNFTDPEETDDIYNDLSYGVESACIAHNDSSCLPIQHASKPRSDAKFPTYLSQASALDLKIGACLSMGRGILANLPGLMALRSQLQHACASAILLDLPLADQYGMETLLWKSAFYQVIEILRTILREESNEIAKSALDQLLKDGLLFYEDLLTRIQNFGGFELKDISGPHPTIKLSRPGKIAAMSVQRCLICLGDISRYVELSQEHSTFSISRVWYNKAQMVAPKNGRPYNQLALLALYTRRKLDAVYFYMRSLAASNPFLTARESLLALFDEIRKKSEQTRRSREQQKQIRQLRRKDQRGIKKEIWLKLDGTEARSPESEDEKPDLSALPVLQLNKQLLVSFLNVHGILFNRINLDSFFELGQIALEELAAILMQTPLPVTSHRLLQFTTINIFSIDNSTPTEQLEENSRLLVQDEATVFGLSMLNLIVKSCCERFSKQLVMTDDLRVLLPAIKIFSDWMLCHVSVWNPLPQYNSTSQVATVWESLAAFANYVDKLEMPHIEIYAHQMEGCHAVDLDEDLLMRGFLPLLAIPPNVCFADETTDKDSVKDYVRIQKFLQFADFLCGMDDAVLSYDVVEKCYVAVTADPSSQESQLVLDKMLLNETTKNFYCISGVIEDDDVIESSSDEYFSEEENKDEQLEKLKKRKDDLLKLQALQAERQDEVDAVRDNFSGSEIFISIRPRNLVADTNCLLNHLEGLHLILDSNKYQVIIPLIVLTELEGLSKGPLDSRDVSAQALSALSSLEAAFAQHKGNLKAMTSEGTLLDTLAYRSEQIRSSGNNDDLILNCCLQFVHDRADNYMPKNKDNIVRLTREVLLLTEDRNLWVKAHSYNIPVRDLPIFMRWAQLA